MAKFKKSFNNPFSFSDFTSNSSDLYDYTMNNLMDNFYDSSMNHSTKGNFKAVCLSGMIDEDNTGAGTGENSGQVQGKYVFIAVRPLAPIGNILPDPRQFDDPTSINDCITLHGQTFLARSDYEFTTHLPIRFGQVVNCYFEKGSIKNSDFRGLRFRDPHGVTMDDSFVLLGAKTGVQTQRAAFVNGNVVLVGGLPGPGSGGPAGNSPPINPSNTDTSQNIVNMPWQIPDVAFPVDRTRGSVRLGSPYGYRKMNGVRKPHGGWDFPDKSEPGLNILAIADGKVTRSGKSGSPDIYAPEIGKTVGQGGFGMSVGIDHGEVKMKDGTTIKMRSQYGHFYDIYDDIKAGVEVKKGQPLGILGTRGSSTGPHLHLDVFLDGKKVDPCERFGWWDLAPWSHSSKKAKFLRYIDDLVNNVPGTEPYSKRLKYIDYTKK